MEKIGGRIMLTGFGMNVVGVGGKTGGFADSACGCWAIVLPRSTKAR
jgi:hypothetical protein